LRPWSPSLFQIKMPCGINIGTSVEPQHRPSHRCKPPAMIVLVELENTVATASVTGHPRIQVGLAICNSHCAVLLSGASPPPSDHCFDGRPIPSVGLVVDVRPIDGVGINGESIGLGRRESRSRFGCVLTFCRSAGKKWSGTWFSAHRRRKP